MPWRRSADRADATFVLAPGAKMVLGISLISRILLKVLEYRLDRSITPSPGTRRSPRFYGRAFATG